MSSSIRTTSVFELRQYTLRPGSRDAFVALFDAELVDTQDAVGIRVLGQFCDLDRPDAFVWMRAFADMAGRSAALHAFYGGPVWAAHRDAANGMMLDSDDVLLLEPEPVGSSADDWAPSSPAPGAVAATGGLVLIDVTPVRPEDTSRFLDHYRSAVLPTLQAAGGEPVAQLSTLHAVNNFPRLPVREGEHVVVTVIRVAGPGTADAIAADRAYRSAAAELDGLATASPQRLRLAPTPRSMLR